MRDQVKPSNVASIAFGIPVTVFMPGVFRVVEICRARPPSWLHVSCSYCLYTLHSEKVVRVVKVVEMIKIGLWSECCHSAENLVISEKREF